MEAPLAPQCQIDTVGNHNESSNVKLGVESKWLHHSRSVDKNYQVNIHHACTFIIDHFIVKKHSIIVVLNLVSDDFTQIVKDFFVH